MQQDIQIKLKTTIVDNDITENNEVNELGKLYIKEHGDMIIYEERLRSEERRVGKECRSWWTPHDSETKIHWFMNAGRSEGRHSGGNGAAGAKRRLHSQRRWT